MMVSETRLPGVKLVEPRVFGDARGYFFESWSAERYAQELGSPPFVQDNLSRSERGVVRALHLQHPHSQAKLVWVPAGRVFDVAVDVRVGSPHFGSWVGYELSDDNHRQLFIPPGFAHGFCVLSESALFCYKCTDYYHPACELGVRYDDPDLGIEWPVTEPRLSQRDLDWPRLRDVPAERLPRHA